MHERRTCKEAEIRNDTAYIRETSKFKYKLSFFKF
jgi:hypothetical protein